MIDTRKQMLFAYKYADTIVTLSHHEVGRELAGIEDVERSDCEEREHGFSPLGDNCNIILKDGIYTIFDGRYQKI